MTLRTLRVSVYIWEIQRSRPVSTWAMKYKKKKKRSSLVILASITFRFKFPFRDDHHLSSTGRSVEICTSFYRIRLWEGYIRVPYADTTNCEKTRALRSVVVARTGQRTSWKGPAHRHWYLVISGCLPQGLLPVYTPFPYLSWIDLFLLRIIRWCTFFFWGGGEANEIPFQGPTDKFLCARKFLLRFKITSFKGVPRVPFRDTDLLQHKWRVLRHTSWVVRRENGGR